MRPSLFICALALSGCLQAETLTTQSDFNVNTSFEEDLVTSIPEAMMGRLQEDLDFEHVQAAAILGNLAHETGNFTMLQQIGGSAYGYSQWMGSRRNAFFSFAQEHGGRHTFDANYGFLLHEITTYYEPMIQRMRNTEDVEQASRIFMREFLRPNPRKANLPKRVSYAQAFLSEDFSRSGCLGEEFQTGNRITACQIDQ